MGAGLQALEHHLVLVLQPVALPGLLWLVLPWMIWVLWLEMLRVPAQQHLLMRGIVPSVLLSLAQMVLVRELLPQELCMVASMLAEITGCVAANACYRLGMRAA